MGINFRKSVNFGPFRLNFSKSGIGYSIGGKGFRFTKKANGGFRTTVSIPNTGISVTKDIPAPSNTKHKEKEEKYYTIGAQLNKESIPKMHSRTLAQYTNIILEKVELIQQHPDKFSRDDVEKLYHTLLLLKEENQRRSAK